MRRTIRLLLIMLLFLLLQQGGFLFAAPTPEQIKMANEMLKQRAKPRKLLEESANAEMPPVQLKETIAPEQISPAQLEQEHSTFEAYIKGKLPSTVSTELKQFGYGLFRTNLPTTFAPAEIVPVGPDYLLGPGDELRISIWGKVNADHTVLIDREGKITLPQMGILYLSGLTFSEAGELLEKELSRYYKRGEVYINMSMGRLRTIRVFIVGKARRPGSYTISSLSTLIHALFAAGGPTKIGTMRDIQVKRNGKTIVHFDLYDFLLQGDKTMDIRLMPEDVIFIPIIGPLVGIAGSVRNPAIYELKGETSLRELLEMAGGVSATGYLPRVQVERILDNSAKAIQDLNLQELKEDEKVYLKDGDIVKVFYISQAVKNPIEIKGNLSRPGTYEWREGLKIRDIIPDTDSFLPDTFMEFAMIERLVPPDYHKEYLSVNLGKLFIEGDEEENINLMPYDKLMIFNKWDLMDGEYVHISSAVNRPGKYEYRPNMRILDLLKLAGGLKKYAYTEESELTRIHITQKGPITEKILINLDMALAGNPEHNIALMENDYLLIRTVPEWELYRTLSIQGEVRFPGVYTIKKGDSLSSLIERAGGFTDNAYLKGAVFTRESVKELQQRQLDEAIDRMERQLFSKSAMTIETALTPEAAEQQKAALEQRMALVAKLRTAKAKGRIAIKLDKLDKFKGSFSDVVLEKGDTLLIPERPIQIQVLGSVYNQNAFVHNPNITIASYLRKAGGLTKDADKKEVYVLKVDGMAMSKRESFRFTSMRLDPGDTIVVPEKVEKTAWLREIKDITQILYQIAVTAGVLIVRY